MNEISEKINHHLLFLPLLVFASIIPVILSNKIPYIKQIHRDIITEQIPFLEYNDNTKERKKGFL